MYIDKIIKREFLALLVCVIVLVSFIIGFSYSYFLNVSSSDDIVINTSSINIDLCVDSMCKEKYNKDSNIIGTTLINDSIRPQNIYPYLTKEEALLEKPYIFNISNSGSLDVLANVTLTSKNSDYDNMIDAASLYSDYVMIGISSCDNFIDRNNVNVFSYGSLINNTIINDIELRVNDSKTYCLWTWLSGDTPNSIQNTYFIADLNAEALYIPKK